MPGRKRKPAAVKVAEGNPGHRPIPEEIQFSGVPECPKFLDRRAKAEWKRILAATADLDLFRAVDVGVLASYCVAYSRWQTAEETLMAEGTTIKLTGSNGQDKIVKHPALMVSADAQKQMLRAGSLLGFNPTDRSKVSAPQREGSNEFLEFD